MYKCSKCGKQYEDEQYLIKRNKKRKDYTCIECFEDVDEFYWYKLYEMICKNINADKLNIKQIAQLKRMKKEDKLTFAGMYYCISYMSLIGKEADEKYDLIGLIPYYYDEASRFWKKKWNLEDTVEKIKIEGKTKIVKTKVVFGKGKSKKELNFDFLNESEE